MKNQPLTIPDHATFPENGGSGLSKREYFASMAMQGNIKADTNFDCSSSQLAGWAVECADALIEALNKSK